MDNKIYITDENGKEKAMNILMTFDLEDQNVVLVYDKDDPDTIIPFFYDENGNLFAVEDEDALEAIQEVLDAWESEQDNEESN